MQPQSRRIRTWAIRVVAIALVACVGYHAYLRLTTPALTLEEAFERFGPLRERVITHDVTASLVAAYDRLPPRTPVIPTPPAGMKWEGDGVEQTFFDMSEITLGPWTPDDRHYLRMCIDYLEKPEVEATLAQIHELRAGQIRCDNLLFPFLDDGRISGVTFRDLAKTLAAGMRYAAESNDIETFLLHLETLLWLADTRQNGTLIGALGGMSIEQMAFQELGFQIRAGRVPPETFAHIESLVDNLPDLQQEWRMSMAGEIVFSKSLIATRYANTVEGPAWLLLSETDDPTKPRSRFWDLLTVFHNDFDTVSDKIETLTQDLADAGELPYKHAMQRFQEISEHHPLFTAVDGDLSSMFGDMNDQADLMRRLFSLFARAKASRDAIRIELALGKWRLEHDAYPDALQQLAPDAIAAIPEDPFCGEPFHYERLDKQYRLWTCGEDGEDQGGIPRNIDNARTKRFDIVYTVPRRDALFELRLVPISNASTTTP